MVAIVIFFRCDAAAAAVRPFPEPSLALPCIRLDNLLNCIIALLRCAVNSSKVRQIECNRLLLLSKEKIENCDLELNY